MRAVDEIDIAASNAAASLAAMRTGGAHGPLGHVRSRLDGLVRSDAPELLDLESTPAGVRTQILEDVDRLNGWFRLYPTLLRRLDPLVRAASRREAGRPVRILDVGTGHGGLLFAIDAWAQRRKLRVDLSGCDVAEPLLDLARRRAGERGVAVHLFQADARRLDRVADGEYDIALLTLALHHLAPADAARVLIELDRVSREGFLVLDLSRSLLALPLFWLLLRATAWAPTRHDGVQSMRRAYTPDEVRALAAATGVRLRVESLGPGLWLAGRSAG